MFVAFLAGLATAQVIDPPAIQASGVFTRNILTLNPGWDQKGATLPPLARRTPL